MINNSRKILLFLCLFLCGVLPDLYAQASTITFNVNLQPELKDSIFIPSRDRILVTGNQHPFSRDNNRLTDTTPIDSVYSITLRFMRGDLNKTFNFNYVMYIDGKPRRESMVRQIEIQPGRHNLDALYFDGFAW